MTPTPLSPAEAPSSSSGTPWFVNLLRLAVPPAIGYAQKWLDQEHLQSLVETLPGTLEKTGSQVVARFRKMSTVEKVASGLLLAVVVRHFLRKESE